LSRETSHAETLASEVLTHELRSGSPGVPHAGFFLAADDALAADDMLAEGSHPAGDPELIEDG